MAISWRLWREAKKITILSVLCFEFWLLLHFTYTTRPFDAPAGEFGVSRMFIIYTASGVIGFWISCLFGVLFTIGASASICGLIGAMLFYGKSRGGVYGQAIYRQVFGWVIGLFLFGFMIPGINNWGHGGGLLAGILFGFILSYQEKKPERLVHKTTAVICITVTVAVLGWAIASGVYYRFQ